jgi:thiol-disulfide isomerase/thioredoxin
MNVMTLTAKSVGMSPVNRNIYNVTGVYKKMVINVAKDQPKTKLLENGSDAPDFTVYTKNGDPVKLSDYKGKAVLIDFWSTWCGPCQKALPHTQSLAKKYNAQGLVTLGINVWDQKQAFLDWLPKHESYDSIVFLIDTTKEPGQDVASKLYNVTGIPTVYVIDKTGKVVASECGYDEHGTTIETAIKIAIK